jgi:hypothetical protein
MQQHRQKMWAALPLLLPLPTATGAADADAAGGPLLQLQVPAWTWEPDASDVAQHCLALPNVTGVWYNESVTWTNNSRLLSVAVPKGTPPPGGWPVMVDLLVIDYPSLFGEPLCGLDGRTNSATRNYPPSKACAALATQLCGDKLNTTHAECTYCFMKNRTALMAVCEKKETHSLMNKCPVQLPPAPLKKTCTAALATACNWTFSIPDASNGKHLQHRNCTHCVAAAQFNLSSHAATECPQVTGAPHRCDSS